jgi:hypothetical protein
MKYIQTIPGQYREVSQVEYDLWQQAPEANRPTFLEPTDPGVVAVLAAQQAAVVAGNQDSATRLAGAQAIYDHSQNGLTPAMIKALFGVDIVP